MIDRREFLQRTGVAVSAIGALSVPQASAQTGASSARTIRFDGPDSLFHGHGWETLNPGYWKIENHALRRRLTNVGDRARATGFPFHAATAGRVMNPDYDPSLPEGVIYRNDWKMSGDFAVTAKITYHGRQESRREGDKDDWKMYQPGHGMIGLAIGAKSLFESFTRIRHTILCGWTDDQRLSIAGARRRNNSQVQSQESPSVDAPAPQPGDTITIRVEVSDLGNERSEITTVWICRGVSVVARRVVNASETSGYIGIVGRGLLDFEVNEFEIEPGANTPLDVREVDCLTCYPLGDSLRERNGTWSVRFVALFASDGETVEIRISDTPDPAEGWGRVPIAGSAKIVNHEWRRNTAVIHTELPYNPADKTLYYTVWKDGHDVTADPRIGSDATGPGTGVVGDVPSTGRYVGRLPQLNAPYKLCGLSCHAITSGLQQRTENGLAILGGGDDWQWRDQPTVEAYKHLEDYDFQVMVWEDDVWYMELAFYPPSTDDAYKVVTNSICGPTSRWQMMRHWNVINPGDHDYGMDDVKGPEQLAIRTIPGLGQDIEYMQRNFQIVHHLITGNEEVDPIANPKKWRAWKMPNRDFTFVILDSRLWRSSQDVDIWDDAGWGHFKSIYNRNDPTRSLLGEEQFGWLQELLATDSSPLIALTGINGMHTVWAGSRDFNNPFDQRSRVTADYAGWVKAGADRVLELLGGRTGIVSVYGDVHNGCLMKNRDQGVIECSFGPIGRSGGRTVIPGFGPRMRDFDGRELEVTALYHSQHADPELNPHHPGEPFYWNFLEMEFDPTHADPHIGLRLRNLIDAPTVPPRGGDALETSASKTGRRPTCRLPEIQTLPNADVRLVHTNGKPIRGIRSRGDGSIPPIGLADIHPGTQLIVTAFDGQASHSSVVKTEAI